MTRRNYERPTISSVSNKEHVPFCYSQLLQVVRTDARACRPQPLVLDLHSMCTKYSPHRLRMPCGGGSGGGAVVEAADFVRSSDVESGAGVNPKAHFHLYEVTSSPHTSAKCCRCTPAQTSVA